jgi:hypothetical protein
MCAWRKIAVEDRLGGVGHVDVGCHPESRRRADADVAALTAPAGPAAASSLSDGPTGSPFVISAKR